jgi:hypothetical protein
MKHPPQASCCDICNPQLSADLFGSMDKPTKPPTTPRRAQLPSKSDSPESLEDLLLRSHLKSWREEAATRQWGPFFLVGGLGIISDPQIERIVGLARLGLLPNVDALKSQLKWCFHSEYGAEVVGIVQEVYSTCPPPTKARSPVKRKVSKSETPSRAASPAHSASSSQTPAGTTGAELKAKRLRRCGLCGGTDHIGELTVASAVISVSNR